MIGDKPAMTQLDFQVENLGCASCAVRMEEAIGQIDGVRTVRLDFATARLHVDLNDGHDARELSDAIQGVVRSIEKDTCLVDQPGTRDGGTHPSGPAQHLPTTGSRWLDRVPVRAILRLAAGMIIFVLPWLLRLPVLPARAAWLAAWLILGADVVLAAVRQIWRRRWLDEHFLMSVATIGALAIGEYPEAVAVMLFYQIGELLQGLAVDHSRRSIRALLAIRPDQAIKISATGHELVAPASLSVGDQLMIRPGDRVALDSRILEGQSELDTAALTGENRLQPVGPGEEIRAGFVNGSGLLIAEVLRNEADSSISRILALVETAAQRKAPTERFMTRFARVYTPIMIGLALLVALLPPILWQQSFDVWLYRALILLVISCPCALVLSIPLSYFAGIGAASARGILIKGGQYLDRLGSIRGIAWDKTGTLTQGQFAVNAVWSYEPGQESKVLEWAALAEYGSTHPLARSILKAWREDSDIPLDRRRIQSVRNKPGLGLQAVIDHQEVLLGSQALMKEQSVAVEALPCSQDPAQDDSRTVLYLAVDGHCLGRIELADQLRPEAAGVIRELRALGIRLHVLLSGDHQAAVARIAAQAGMDGFQAGLLPDQKVSALEHWIKASAEHRPIAYVGDGINDAPVLARADLSVALGGGSEAALERADLVIVGDDLKKLPQAVRLARKTGRIVRQNITLALGLKILILLLALVGVSGIWQAVFADVGVTVLAVLNALRILKK